MSRVTSRADAFVAFGLRQHVELAEHLLERLHDLAPQTIALPVRPLASGEEIVRMREPNARVRLERGERTVVAAQSRTVVGRDAAATVAHDDEATEERREHGMRHELDEFRAGEHVAADHRVLERRAHAALLASQRARS